MSLNQADLKAIEWFCQTNNLKPQMSVVPVQMNFTDRTTGLEKTCHLDNITIQYKAHIKDEQKRIAREKLYA